MEGSGEGEDGSRGGWSLLSRKDLLRRGGRGGGLAPDVCTGECGGRGECRELTREEGLVGYPW